VREGFLRSLLMAFVLGAFAVVAIGMVTWVFNASKARIIENERVALVKQLSALLPEGSYDNYIVNDTVHWVEPDLAVGKALTIFRFRKNTRPVAVVIPAVAPGGYNGKIKLLVAINKEGVVSAVRVTSHHETPGLGDKMEIERSDWINVFKGKSFKTLPESQWKVKRDGGVIDQFTGATITPRAIVQAVKKTVVFFEANREALFLPEPIKD
jgi:Na+-translocating ferredoxin:NAD+ oxidoreductase subunit G